MASFFIRLAGPSLRFIDTQNPDGSYTYGYESGDGTYKLETR